jgi:hypothetical protein
LFDERVEIVPDSVHSPNLGQALGESLVTPASDEDRVGIVVLGLAGDHAVRTEPAHRLADRPSRIGISALATFDVLTMPISVVVLVPFIRGDETG